MAYIETCIMGLFLKLLPISESKCLYTEVRPPLDTGVYCVPVSTGLNRLFNLFFINAVGYRAPFIQKYELIFFTLI